jgi:two-component system nitrogen regulation response regulator NtrX
VEAEVEKGSFRQDLFHRVYVFPVALPPLRERLEDIPVLAEHFARQVAEQNGWKTKEFTPDAIEELKRYSWPGNVRELRNVVERVLLLAPDGPVDDAVVRRALPQASAGAPTAALGNGTLAERVEAFERETLLEELKRHHHHMTNTAKALGLERSHLYKKCQQLGIDLRAARKAD